MNDFKKAERLMKDKNCKITKVKRIIIKINKNCKLRINFKIQKLIGLKFGKV
jgi:hypothetical protein